MLPLWCMMPSSPQCVTLTCHASCTRKVTPAAPADLSHLHLHLPSFRLMLQASHGPRVVLLLQKLLPPGQVDALQEGPPDAAVRCLDRVVETPECLWDMQMAAAAAAEVAMLAATLRKQQVGPCGGACAWPGLASIALFKPYLSQTQPCGSVHLSDHSTARHAVTQYWPCHTC